MLQGSLKDRLALAIQQLGLIYQALEAPSTGRAGEEAHEVLSAVAQGQPIPISPTGEDYLYLDTGQMFNLADIESVHREVDMNLAVAGRFWRQAGQTLLSTHAPGVATLLTAHSAAVQFMEQSAG